MSIAASANRRPMSWSKAMQGALTVIAIAMIVGTIAFGVFLPIGTVNIRVSHLLLCFILLFGQQVTRGGRMARSLWLVLLLASAGSLTYVLVNQVALEERVGFPNRLDTAVGLVVIVAAFAGSYRAWGPIVPVIAAIGVGYAFWGMYLPDVYAAPRVRPEYILGYLTTNLSGAFGPLLQISALYILPFVVFGQLLKVAGVTLFISEGGKLLSRRIASAPALTAVVGSGIVGMATGSPVANILMTGTFTIPWMKKTGYTPSLAGAIEACASSGSQIMPPVMGAVAFIMAYYLEVPYIQVAIAAILPALLYYAAIFFGTYFASKRLGLKRIAEPITAGKGTVLTKALIFVLALAVTTFFLARQYSVGYAGTFGIAVLLVSGLIESLITRDLRSRLKEWLKECSDGAILVAQLGVVLALMGMFTEVISNTGMGVKLTSAFVMLAAGNVWLMSLLAATVILILGCAIPTAPAYIIGILVIAPALQKLGIGGFQLHFFLLYYAVFSLITPPVALACMVAAKVAGSNYLRTAWDSVKLAAIAWLLPLLFLTNPGLLLAGPGVLSSVTAFVVPLIAVLFLSSGSWGYLLTALTRRERILAGMVGMGWFTLILAHLFEVIFVAGLSLLTLVFLGRQLVALRRAGKHALL